MIDDQSRRGILKLAALGFGTALTGAVAEAKPARGKGKRLRPGRRVVTTHDAHGRSKFLLDGAMPVETSPAPGVTSRIIWASDRHPASNAGDADGSLTDIAKAVGGGSIFSMTDFEPGSGGPMHRTISLDYGVVLSGSIWLILDEGEVRLDEGDVYVQRGTIHAWSNRGPGVCRLLTVGFPAESVTSPRGPLAPVHA